GGRLGLGPRARRRVNSRSHPPARVARLAILGRMPRVRLPFYYGWLLVGTAFVTMGIGVNARTAFSLFFPPILNEVGWDRGLTAGAFSFWFLVLDAFSPLLGSLVGLGCARLLVAHGVGRGG